jgi:hypothetical protein
LNDIEQRIKNFSNTKDLLKTYMNTEKQYDSKKPENLPENPIIEFDIDKLSAEDEKKDINTLIKNLKKINFETIQNESMNLEKIKSDYKIKLINYFRKHKKQYNINEIYQKKISVKFFISEIVYSDKTKNFRKICSQFFGNIPEFKKEIDDIKIAIIIGPWFDI